MKKLLVPFFLTFCLIFSHGGLKARPIPFLGICQVNDGIENGWYEATVKYYNYRTLYRSTYALNVKVEYDRVTVIDFGNGGSLHSGFNNSGYIYSGGYLTIERDYDYNAVAATARVTVTDQNGNIKSFDIRIE